MELPIDPSEYDISSLVEERVSIVTSLTQCSVLRSKSKEKAILTRIAVVR